MLEEANIMTNLLVKTVAARGREFYVIENEHGFWGIESNKFKDGVLTEKITGLTGMLTKSVEQTTNLINQAIEVDFLEENGMNRMDAVLKVCMGR